MERCLACEADSVATMTIFEDYDPAPLAHDKGGRAACPTKQCGSATDGIRGSGEVGSSRAVGTSLAHGQTTLSRRGTALGFGKYPADAGRRRNPSRRFRLQSAFSLVEVLASLFILTLSAVGITAAWRLADYQELLTRADRRAERILREYYELQTFAPADSRPFTVNASASPSPSPITGYLYYPRQIANQNGSGAFGKMIPFSISMTNGTAGAQLVLTYTIPTYGTQASRQVTKTVVLNP